MIQVRLFGALDLVGDDGKVMREAMRRPKVIAVLAYLAAARPRGMQRRDKVAAFFWPDLSGERARAALRVTLTRLRDDIGSDVVISRGADEIGIDPSRVACDVVALEEALARSDVDAAATLYRGPFMDGVHVEGTADELEEWMSLERARLRDETIRALLDGASRAPTRRAVSLAQQALAIAPDDERVARALIAALLAAGDRSAAVRVYDDLVTRLTRDFGVVPSAETRELIEQVRAEDRSAMRVTSREGTQLRSTHRTRQVMSVTAVAAALVLLAGAAIARERWAAPEVATFPWRMVAPRSDSRPRGRLEGGAVLDSTDDAVLLFGGQGFAVDSIRVLGDLWRLRGIRPGQDAQWTRVQVASGAAPRPRWLFGMAYDAAGDRAIVHGGALGGTAPCANDTWILDRATGLNGPSEWRRVAITGALPPPRAGFHAYFDPKARQLFFFGGHDCYATFYNDVWTLTFDDSSLGTGHWRQEVVDESRGLPGRRSAYGAAFDVTTGRLFVHGGSTSTAPSAGLWALERASSAPAWRPLKCAGEGPARNSESMTFDHGTGTLAIFGGIDSVSAYHRDLWRVTGLSGDAHGCQWERVQSEATPPAPRGGAALLIDPRTRALILFGGYFQDAGFADVWTVPGFFRLAK